nr:hypothetical protein [uncultured Flavobacterium sp.]
MNAKYEALLKELNPHLQNHPSYMPHIGDGYDAVPIKIMIVAESHYLPKYLDDKITVEDWYDNPQSVYIKFENSYDKGWINTQGVINHYRKEQKNGALVLFANLEKAYAEAYPGKLLFDECIFLNYFQRPAERRGESIRISKRDSEVALQNLLTLIDVAKPNKIIFVSSKAHKDFQAASLDKGIAKDDLPYVGTVPHAGASVWWNKASKKFALKGGKPVTGRQKFIRIVTPKNVLSTPIL